MPSGKARFALLEAVLLKTQAFWNLTPYRLVNTNVSKSLIPSYSGSRRLFRLLDDVYEQNTFIRNVGKSFPDDIE
jgi:hypothetical protein